ncbi:Dabb family protein [uncultured Butyricimonas sp.]|uniref:Dabb family protein n=1 Tax=uncultured Butyricimonas sp. TaxID=1268785 RepID=UPI00259901B8|nr:Dabb family protein [uncultured Butyricimonas sp.]
MLKHIVMWKLKEFAEGKTKAENALIMKESLERLVGIVPEIISLQVGINEKESDMAYDAIVFQKVCKFFLFSSLQIYSFLIK